MVKEKEVILKKDKQEEYVDIMEGIYFEMIEK